MPQCEEFVTEAIGFKAVEHRTFLEMIYHPIDVNEHKAIMIRIVTIA